MGKVISVANQKGGVAKKYNYFKSWSWVGKTREKSVID